MTLGAGKMEPAAFAAAAAPAPAQPLHHPQPLAPVQPLAPKKRLLQLQKPSRLLLRFFDRYLRYYLRRHFHGLRLAGGEHWPASHGPLLICLNHASWWDPLSSILLSRCFAKQADHYAPMDTRAFARYGILRKLGLFPVEQGTPRGAVQLLRTAEQILADPEAVLWMTPQGGFTDVRVRPVVFRAGLDALLRRAERVTVLPLAIEYTFWDERLPEALALLGSPLVFTGGRAQSGDAGIDGQPTAGEQVAHALAQTQDALAALAARRDPALFVPVLAGSAGTGGVYGAWQRLRARALGRRFHPEHASLAAEETRTHGAAMPRMGARERAALECAHTKGGLDA